VIGATGQSAAIGAAAGDHYKECAGFFADAVVVTAVEKVPAEKPQRFELYQNYPNPFNPETAISFALPEAGNVTLDVFDLMGRQVADLAQGRFEAGVHRVVWNAAGVSSGIYFYRLQSGIMLQAVPTSMGDPPTRLKLDPIHQPILWEHPGGRHYMWPQTRRRYRLCLLSPCQNAGQACPSRNGSWRRRR
jgi:hypothetical protein